jgi:flagellar P-ring protein precursor FlgI
MKGNARRLRSTLLLALAVWLLAAPIATAEVRIKDITDVEGARNNQLFGFGLVTGLAGTGSRSLFTQQVAVDMLQRLNVTSTIFSQLPSDNVIRSTTISAVMVTAEIGPFVRPGQRLDVTVSSMDDATSLQGGTLILTPLRGADNEIYAVAQGQLSIGGFIASGQAASVQKNHPTVGRIPGGALVEKESLGEVLCRGCARLLVKNPDFNTARLIAKAINERFPCSAIALDGGAVQVVLPKERCTNPMGFLSEIGLLTVSPDMPARVVINERTGTVVVGHEVKIATTAVAHGNLAIVTAESPVVSQPEPFAKGRTVVVPRTQLNVTEQKNQLIVVPRSFTVADLARALNALGVSPRDLISIFQALKEAGALHAELVIM